MNRFLSIALLAALTGCGAMQSYNQYLDNRQRTFERQQAVLEAQNQVRVAQLQVQVAQQQAQVNIEIARGKATAQEIQTRSLKPIFVQQELVDAIHEGKVETLVLPQNTLLSLTPGGTAPRPAP